MASEHVLERHTTLTPLQGSNKEEGGQDITGHQVNHSKDLHEILSVETLIVSSPSPGSCLIEHAHSYLCGPESFEEQAGGEDQRVMNVPQVYLFQLD